MWDLYYLDRDMADMYILPIVERHYVHVTRLRKAMELTGGEYWTYFLQGRVGKNAARELTSATRPITAGQAHAIGMVDDLMQYPPSASFREEVRDKLVKILRLKTRVT